ncbi:hypothetical protein AWN76_012765 [Rhodothermaceae bacterium RA]|nr:hypothetical protein AWN76_012765 [Rhodothermaceae bacterium RA]
MDRNVVIATVLIAAIMFVWLYLLAPPPPVEPTAQEDPITDTSAVATAPDEEAFEAGVARMNRRPALVDSTIAGAGEGEERRITVETDLYEATFSTRGATLTSFVLKTYKKFDQQTPVQLVSDSTDGALALVFTTPANHLVDTRAFFFEADVSEDRLRVTDAPATLTFTARVGQGEIRQTYTFTPGSYEVGLAVDQTRASTFSTQEGYELIWDGGLPFTEGDPENEAQRAGAFARSGGEVESVELMDEDDVYLDLNGRVDWVAVKNKYFTAVLIPDGESVGGELEGEQVGQPPAVWEDYTVRLAMPPPRAGTADTFRLYLGPMEYYRIAAYDLGLYDMVDFGYDMFEWITRPLARFIFIPAFTFLSEFIPSYGIVIIILAILMKLLLYPLTKSSYRSMARMRELQPKMEEIKEKYADNPQKQQEAMMKLYRETGVNPLGSCLPMFLQWPVIIALWQFLPQSIEIRQQGFLWAHDLSAPDVILNLPFTIPLYGNFVAGFTLLMGLSMVIQMRIQMASTPSNPQTKIFTYVMPVMIFAFFNRLASGLSLYYLCFNILSAAQQKLINRSIEKEKEEGGGANGKGSSKIARDAQSAARKSRGGRRSPRARAR